MIRDHIPGLRSKPISSFDEQPEEWRVEIEKIKQRWEREMEPLHKHYRDRWDYIDGLYLTYDQLRSRYRDARGHSPDRDTAGRAVLLDARRDWGGHLIIPYAFATVETVVPRVIANRPRFLAKALESWAEDVTGPIQDAVNQQLADIDFELKLSPTARRAVKLGLGVQFTDWRESERQVVRWGVNQRGEQVPVQTKVVDRRGPWVEDVDIYDWFWDNTAKSVETCEDILYRVWRPFSYIEKMVRKGREMRAAGKAGGWNDIDLDAVKRMGKGQERNDIWAGRNEVRGIHSAGDLKEGAIHEVWHYFKGEKVETILDRTFLAQDDITPHWHRELPFQAYRPTPLEGQLPGLGVIDSMQQLIAELSTMRTQRRDAATYALNPPTFFQKGTVNRSHMKTGPGVWIPVNGDIRESIWQPQLRDLPSSAYAEEDRIKADIEMTTGVSDPVAGGGGGQGGSAGTETATGIQLIQAAANVRIAQMARLLLLEVMRPFGRQVLELNRQHNNEPMEVRVEDKDAERGYSFKQITPEDWAAPIELVPEEHSNEPNNEAEKRQNGLLFFQALQNVPGVNQRELVKDFATEWGVSNPERLLDEQIRLDPEMARVVGESFKGTLVGAGIEEDAAEAIVKQAMEAAMETAGVTPEQGQNGAAPQEAPAGA